MRSTVRIALLTALGALFTSTAAAQAVLYRWLQPQTPHPAAAGDVDGDGFTDFAVGLPHVSRVHLYSGATGLEIRRLTGMWGRDGFGGELLSLGDVDGDGRADLVVTAAGDGSGNAAYLELVSGADGMQIWFHAPPLVPQGAWHSPVLLTDLDGDGVRDLAVVGYSGWGSGPGTILVLSGGFGNWILRRDGAPGTSEFLYGELAAAGDFDGDGVEDFLVGDPTFDSERGRVLVCSGSDASTLSTIHGAVPGAWFGADVVAIEDLDGDGIREVFSSAPLEPVSALENGRVHLFSGASSTLLLSIDDASSPGILMGFGRNLHSFSDLDGDGYRDLFLTAGSYRVGCCGSYPAEARIYSSRSGAMLFQGSGHSTAGCRAAVTPDLDGDGVEEYLYHAYSHWDLSRVVGLALVGSGGASYWDWACTTKPTSSGCQPVILHRGFPSLSLGQGVTFEAHRLPPGTTGFFAWSRTLDVRPFAGATLCLGAPIHRLTVLGATDDGPTCSGGSGPTGSMSLQLSPGDLAQLGLAPGDAFLVQGWFRDPGYTPPEDQGLTTMVMFPVLP